MARRKICTHPPVSAFVAFKAKGSGVRIWRCSHCGKEDVWGYTWAYYGPVECLGCGSTGAEAVTCSDECRAKFKPTDPALALRIAKERR